MTAAVAHDDTDDVPGEQHEETIAEWVTRTRTEQGLPPTIEDPVQIATIAALLRGAI